MASSADDNSSENETYRIPWRILAITGALGVALAFFVSYQISQQRTVEQRRRAKQQQQWVDAEFARVKTGETETSVHFPELIVQLAADKECVRRLAWVHFDMVDLSDPRFEQVRKLSNVSKISFYDCEGVEAFLERLAAMPTVNYVCFNTIRITDELVSQLASNPNLKRIRFAYLPSEMMGKVRRELPNLAIEVDDDATGEPVEIQAGI